MKKPVPSRFTKRAQLPTETARLTTVQQIRDAMRNPAVIALWDKQAASIVRKHRLNDINGKDVHTTKRKRRT
jgi:hypothetical protein